MSRYVDADKLIEIINDAGFWESENREVTRYCIDTTPTADVKEVVYCKDCVYSEAKKDTDSKYCIAHGVCFENTFYCGLGKLRGENR